MSKRTAAAGARRDFAKIDAELETARQHEIAAREKVERLRGVIAQASAAEASVQALVAADDGGGLERAAAGDASDLAGLIAKAETAARAAAVAKAALPRAEAAVIEAGQLTEELKRRRQHQLGAALTDQADAVARKYVAAFAQLGELHEELLGIGTALGQLGHDVTMVRVPAIEAPRFNLPAMQGGEVFSTFLQQQPSEARVRAHAARWRQIIAELSGGAADAPAGLVKHPQRERVDERVSELEVVLLPGGNVLPRKGMPSRTPLRSG